MEKRTEAVMPGGTTNGNGITVNRLDVVLRRLAERNEKALALFLTDGYPQAGATPGLVEVLEEGGADIIEIGMPFSDPLADGPVIQESSAAALRNGVTLRSVLGDIETIRKRSEVPLVLMGYLNPILAYGAESFFRDAAAAGADGMILPELPLEECGRFSGHIARAGLAQILLVTPTTPEARMEEIDRASTGFVYCVSTTGVTGRQAGPATGYLHRVRGAVRRQPLLVGFGISSPADVAMMGREADGVIVGSALIRKLRDGISPDALRSWTCALKDALRSAQNS